MAHHALLARRGLQIGMPCEKLGNLRFDGLGQQRTRAAAQDLREGIGEGPWLGELDDVTVGRGVSLLHWRSGGVEHHHDTPPYPFMPSPTSANSSDQRPRPHLALRGRSLFRATWRCRRTRSFWVRLNSLARTRCYLRVDLQQIVARVLCLLAEFGSPLSSFEAPVLGGVGLRLSDEHQGCGEYGPHEYLPLDL
jgi:hypothetical protein